MVFVLDDGSVQADGADRDAETVRACQGGGPQLPEGEEAAEEAQTVTAPTVHVYGPLDPADTPEDEIYDFIVSDALSDEGWVLISPVARTKSGLCTALCISMLDL